MYYRNTAMQNRQDRARHVRVEAPG